MATIWIINQYAPTASRKNFYRHDCFAESLASSGHKVTIIGADYHHLMHEAPSKLHQSKSIYRMHRVSVPKYTESHDRRRILAWLVFAWKICWLRKKLGESPDIVMISSPSLVSFLGAEWIARRSKAKLVFEFRDIWPLSLVELGRFSNKNLFIRLLDWLEHRALKNSDHVISTMPGGPDYVENRIQDSEKTTWLPNGVQLEALNTSNPSYKKSQPDKQKFTVGYTGTIGLANSIDTIIEAAEILKEDYSVQFVIMGDGNYKNKLISKIQTSNLQNVKLLPKANEKEVSIVLDGLDATLLCWRKSSLYQYGTSAMKLPRYLERGKPVLQAYSGNYDPVKTHNAGITVPAEDGKALASAIKNLQQMPKQEKIEMSLNARKTAETVYSYAAIIRKLENCLFR